MAITCKWNVKLAKAQSTDENGKKHNYTFYGGGNVEFIMCYKNKTNLTEELVNFAYTKKDIMQVLNGEINGFRKLTNIKLYFQKDKYSNKTVCEIAKALIKLNKEFKFIKK